MAKIDEVLMRLEINGKTQEFDGAEPETVEQLMDMLEIEAERGVAVAVNDEVVPRRTWSEAAVSDGDRVEIIRATQGG